MLLFVYLFSSGGGAKQSNIKQRRMAKRVASDANEITNKEG
jgi:hypothetical protein